MAAHEYMQTAMIQPNSSLGQQRRVSGCGGGDPADMARLISIVVGLFLVLCGALLCFCIYQCRSGGRNPRHDQNNKTLEINENGTDLPDEECKSLD